MFSAPLPCVSFSNVSCVTEAFCSCVRLLSVRCPERTLDIFLLVRLCLLVELWVGDFWGRSLALRERQPRQKSTDSQSNFMLDVRKEGSQSLSMLCLGVALENLGVRHYDKARSFSL